MLYERLTLTWAHDGPEHDKNGTEQEPSNTKFSILYNNGCTMITREPRSCGKAVYNKGR